MRRKANGYEGKLEMESITHDMSQDVSMTCETHRLAMDAGAVGFYAVETWVKQPREKTAQR